MSWHLQINQATLDAEGAATSIPVLTDDGTVAMETVIFDDDPPPGWPMRGPLVTPLSNGESALMMNTGVFLVSEETLPIPSAGAIALVFGLPAGLNPEPWEPEVEYHILVPLALADEPLGANIVEMSPEAFFLGGRIDYYAMAPYQNQWLYHEGLSDLPVSAEAWHTAMLTWDREATVSRLYLDGVLVAEKPYEVTGPPPEEGLLVLRPGGPNPNAIGVSVVNLALEPTVPTDEEVLEFHTAAMQALEGVAVPGVRLEPGALRWAGDDEAEGWVLRLAVDGSVDEVKLPAAAREYNVWRHYGDNTVHGLAHLYAVNANGWSTPAELEF